LALTEREPLEVAEPPAEAEVAPEM
jgi:hypothetical protein